MSEDKIVEFRKPAMAAHNAAVNESRDHLDAARVVFKLSLASRLDYERQRVKAAKELGCRLSFLDRLIDNIHDHIASMQSDNRFTSFERQKEEKTIKLTYPDDRPSIQCLILAEAKSATTERSVTLLLTTDGQFSVEKGWPITPGQS